MSNELQMKSNFVFSPLFGQASFDIFFRFVISVKRKQSNILSAFSSLLPPPNICFAQRKLEKVG
jgi:hypothetical protein